MADSQAYSRIYDLKTSGVKEVIADVNSVISRLELLGKVKNQVAGSGVGDSKQIADFNRQIQTLIANVEKASKTQLEFADSISHVTMDMQKSAQAMGGNLTATTALLTKSQSMADAAVQEAMAFKLNAEASLASTKEKILNTKETERQERASKKLTGAYTELNAEYKQSAIEAKNLGAQLFVLEKALLESGQIAANDPEWQKLSASLKDAQAKAMGLHEGLLKIDQAVGQSQRNVGNYAGATMAMTQILREAPAFAFNFSTGLLAISNNLPILIDEIQRLNEKNKQLKATGQPTVSVLGQLGNAIFSLNGLLTIGVAALTIYTARMGSASEKAEDLTKKFQELDKSAQEQSAHEYANAQTLNSIAKDVTQSMDIRLRAIKDLQDKYPDYLGNLSKEAILTGQTADAMERLNQALLNKALSEASASKVAEFATKYIKLQDELAEVEKKQNALFGANGTRSLSTREQFLLMQGEKRKAEIQEAIREVDAEMKRYQDMANSFAAKAAPLMVGKADKAAKEKNKEYLDSAKTLADALAQLSTAQVQEDANKNKAIADNEKNSLAERLQAIKNYYADLGVLADIQYRKIVADEEEKKKELDRKKKEGKIGASDYKNEVGASNTRVDAAKQTYDNTIAGNANALSQATTKIYNDEITKINKYLSEEQVLYETAQNEELVMLSESYAKKEISDKKYHAAKKKLIDKYNLDYLQSVVDYLEKELVANKLDADAQKKLADELAAYKKKVLDAQVKANEDARNKEVFDTKKIYSAAIDVFNSFMQAEMELIDRQNAYKERMANRQMEYNRRVRDSQVQSLAEQRANAKADYLQQEQLERQKLQREKKAAQNRLVLNLVVATAKNFAEHEFYDALLNEVVIAGEFAAQEALLNRVQAYKYGKNPDTHLAWVGDGNEHELVRVGNNYSVTPDKPTLVNMPNNASVTPFSMIGNLGNGLKAPSFNTSNTTASGGGGSNYDSTITQMMGMIAETNRGLRNMQINYNPTKATRANNINYFNTTKL